MNIFDDLDEYTMGCGLIDADKLPTPKPFAQGDNGVMFFCEAICIAAFQGHDYLHKYKEVLKDCFIEPGLLVRHPGRRDLDSVDNNLAMLTASTVLGDPEYCRDWLKYGIRHFGIYKAPELQFTKEAFLWRFLQLLAVAAQGADLPNYLKFLFFLPIRALNLYAALVIYLAAIQIKPNTEDMDSRRLTWLLIQGTHKSSMCRWAAKKWYKQLHKDFPIEEWGQSMRGVAHLYYGQFSGGNHPFEKHWVD